MHHFEHQRILGTVVEVMIAGIDDDNLVESIDAAVVAEIGRLERVFSAYDPASELSLWRRGELTHPSAELTDVLAQALEWQQRSGGAFNPLAGELTELWAEAERLGDPPQRRALQRAADAIAAPRYRIVTDAEGPRPEPIGDVTRLNLNAFAKGYIVDRALDIGHAALRFRAAAVAPDRDRVDGNTPGSWICVNAGGDLAHRGEAGVSVGIENPLRPYDNEPPIAVVRVAQNALATSGPARRGFRVGDRWFGHVLDPRSGASVDEIASISVMAHSAAAADVLATVAGVHSPADAIEQLARFGAEGLVIDHSGAPLATSGWDRFVVR